MRPIPSVILALTLCAGAQGASAQAPSQLIAGQVVKVDQSAGKITIKHGPIKKLGMDQGMTMVFKAQDPTMLNSR
jgi:Cu(I)/Ag(I) efflux system periplasmic protein CusF